MRGVLRCGISVVIVILRAFDLEGVIRRDSDTDRRAVSFDVNIDCLVSVTTMFGIVCRFELAGSSASCENRSDGQRSQSVEIDFALT